MKAFDCVDCNKLWEILKEMEMPNQLTCPWETCMRFLITVLTTVRTGHRITDWLKIRKGVWQGYIWSPCLFNLYTEYVMWNTMLDESQAVIKNTRRNINKLRYADDTHLMAESEEALKSLLIGWKREWKNWLETQHSKHKDHGLGSHHFMANRTEKSRSSNRFDFLTLQNHCRWWPQPWN